MTTPEAPQPDRIWVPAHKAAALWKVRRKYVPMVASAHAVRTKKQKSYGTWGETTYTGYNYADAQRVAEAIESGVVVLDPSWRSDTEEGARGARRDAFTACGCLVLMLVVAVAVTLLLN